MFFFNQLILCSILLSAPLCATASQHLHHSCINKDCSALRLTASNPPVNLWDANVISEFGDFLESLDGQNKTKVVVLASDVPAFYIAQIDLNIITPGALPGVNATEVLEQYYANLNKLSTIPVIFIGEVNGRAWGAGDEHLMRMDMRFAGPQAVFGAPEAAVGLIHVGGMQQLVDLIGPGRASEYMLSAAQVGAEEAARVGWVNSAYPTAHALRAHVDKLATRIALFHIEVIRATKASIAARGPKLKDFQDDLVRFDALAAMPFLSKNVGEILALSNNQSLQWELNNNDNVVKGLY
ncbi:hypothetical protein LTS10_007724 [Elasticomyces elasticus]|nr:hypothetical protein LTS10_007724 [Elasticomyces elasticus]